MTRRCLLFACCLLLPSAFAREAFAPFEDWKTAVAAGDRAALQRLYSSNVAGDELDFWSTLHSRGFTEIHPKVLQMDTQSGQTRLLLRVEAVKNSEPVVASALQVWQRAADGWHIAVARHVDFSESPERRLPQPSTPNTDLYPPVDQARAELQSAFAQAAKEHKRVLLVFGGNWCYDCHVLDATFHSPEFAPLVNQNYIVVHINIGDQGRDNNDIAAQYGVALNHGVPSLAVLNPDGSVVTAQKNGEFESTVKIGPADVRAFLEKWKPSTR